MDETIITNQETVYTPDPRDLILTPEAQYYLTEGAGWAKFLGIMGFIGCGIIFILAFAVGAIINFATSMSPGAMPLPPGMGVVIGIVYGLMALLYFFPSLYIYQFGINAKKAILMRGPAEVAISLKKLKSFLKFWGVMMIISIAFGVLCFIGIMSGIGTHAH